MSDIQEAVLEDLNRELQESIDYSSAYYLMMCYWEGQGWTRVELSKLQDNEHAVDITDWLFENGFRDTVNYYREGRKFLFMHAKDATAFTLRWA